MKYLSGMIDFVIKLSFFIWIGSCAHFSIAEPLDRIWVNTCRILNCQLPLDFCIQMSCLGKESCSECISTFFPSCVDCSNQITSSPIILNGASHIFCNRNEPLHVTSCAFFYSSSHTVLE